MRFMKNVSTSVRGRLADHRSVKPHLSHVSLLSSNGEADLDQGGKQRQCN
jgi:hypothetical protein